VEVSGLCLFKVSTFKPECTAI